MTITMLSGGACQVRYPCGDTAILPPDVPIGCCPVCGRQPPPVQVP